LSLPPSSSRNIRASVKFAKWVTFSMLRSRVRNLHSASYRPHPVLRSRGRLLHREIQVIDKLPRHPYPSPLPTLGTYTHKAPNPDSATSFSMACCIRIFWKS
jgi:hypothetical protein